jgi:hypothetical protein
VWIVYKTQINHVIFRENDEVSQVLFVSKQNLIDSKFLRGSLTEKLYLNIIKEFSYNLMKFRFAQ